MTCSVLIPAHNAAATLPDTLHSIQAQTVSPEQVIVACDGCTDATAEIARSLGATVLELPKGNGSIARNRAAEVATSEILFLLDADDQWQPTKVERHLLAWSQNPAASFVIDPSRRVRLDGSQRGCNGQGPAGKLTWKDMVQQRNWSSGSAISVRREAWNLVHGFNEDLPGMQDVEFLIRIAHEVGDGYRISESLTNYFLYPGGVSRTVDWQEQLLKKLEASLPFMAAEDWQSLRRTMALRNALGARFPASLHHMKLAGWPVGDIRFWKYLILSMRNGWGV